MLFVVTFEGLCCFLVQYRDCVVFWYSRGTVLLFVNIIETVQFVGTVEGLCTLFLH